MHRILLIVGCTLTASVAWSQDVVIRLTLDEVLARGLANSPRIVESQARQAGADAVEAARAAEWLPIVALLGGYSRTNHVEEFGIALPGQPLKVIYPDEPDNFRARVDLQWPIYTGGRTGALQRAARAERAAVAADGAAVRSDLRLEITRAFWALVTARETERVVSRAIDNMDAHIRDLSSLLDQGFIPPNELLSAQAQRSRRRLLAIEARNARLVAEADLRRLIGLEGQGPIDPDAALDPVPLAQETGDALVVRARVSRPERRALDDRVTAASARAEAAAAAGLPQVGVTAGYDYARPNPRIFPRVGDWRDSWDVSVNVSWTLWDGGRRRADEAATAAGAAAAGARVAEFDRQTAFEVQQRWLELDSSHAAISTAADGLRSATEAYRVLGERFRAGVATSTEVLDGELALLQAELDRTRALASAKLAQARLDRAVGRP